MSTTRLEARVSVLENDMQWSKSNIDNIYSELNEIKRELRENQNRNDAHFVAIHKEFVDVQKGFVGVQKEFASVHQSIAALTR